MGVIAIKDTAVCIYNNKEERENIFKKYNPKPHEYIFFSDTSEDIKKAKEWAKTKKVIGMKIISEMNNFATLQDMKGNNVSAIKIKLMNGDNFVFVMNDFYFLNTNIRLEYDINNEKLKPIIYTGNREDAMKDLEARIYNYGMRTSKFFYSAAISYFLNFKKILGFYPIENFHEKRFSKYNYKILFSSTFEKFEFVEKEGLIRVNRKGNIEICDEDIFSIEEYLIPEKYENNHIIEAIHALKRVGVL